MPMRVAGPRLYERSRWKSEWPMARLLDMLFTAPYMLRGSSWWTAFPSFSFFRATRSPTIRLSYVDGTGMDLQSVAYQTKLHTLGLLPEVRRSFGRLIAHPRAPARVSLPIRDLGTLRYFLNHASPSGRDGALRRSPSPLAHWPGMRHLPVTAELILCRAWRMSTPFSTWACVCRCPRLESLPSPAARLCETPMPNQLACLLSRRGLAWKPVLTVDAWQ
jgi:hypothetical protein